MGWGETELVHPVHRNAQRKRSHDMKYPLTPVFNNLAMGGRGFSMRFFSLGGFFQQNGITNNFYTDETPEDRGYDAICGKAAYFVETTDSHFTYGDPEAPDYEMRTLTLTRSYVFDTTPGSESVSVDQAAVGDGMPGWSPSPTHSQTASYSIRGNPDNDPSLATGMFDAEHFNPYVWKEITLSGAVTRAYIEGRLSDWQGESQAFRFATDSSIHDTAYATESDDGHAAVNGGHFRIRNLSPFSASLPTPSASEEDLWGGNYYAHILVSRRMLSPALYGEIYKTEDYVSGSKSRQAEGMAIYNAGYSQEQLSDPITENIWRDDYGVFDDGEGLLDDAPKISPLYPYLASLPYITGEGRGHEVVFVTRNGRQTRLTIEEVEITYEEEEPYGEIVTVISSAQIITDPVTLRVAYTFPTLDYWSYSAYRVGLVEQLAGEEWVEVGGEEVIGGDATDPFILVLHYVRERYGERWGFIERQDPYETYYRTMTFTKELSVNTALPEDEAEGGTACGGTVAGAFLLITKQSYSAATGTLQPLEVTDFEMTADGTDWTVSDPQYVDAHVFGTTTVDSSTTLRKEYDGDPREGRFFMRMDNPRYPDGGGNTAFPFGKVISSEWIKVPVTVDGSYHLVDWDEIPTANAGECVTIDGFRLSET
jgi:hypothetical protein